MKAKWRRRPRLDRGRDVRMRYFRMDRLELGRPW